MAADPIQDVLDRLTTNHERIVKYFHDWRQTGAKDHDVIGLTSPDGSGYLNFQFRRADGTLCELSLHPAIVRRESHDEVVIASARFDDDTAARLAWQEMHRVQVQDNRQQVGLHELQSTPIGADGPNPADTTGARGGELDSSDVR